MCLALVSTSTQIFFGVSCFTRVLRATDCTGNLPASPLSPKRRIGLETPYDNPGHPGLKGRRSMPSKEELLKKHESFKDQPAAAELENKMEELKPEEAERIAGGFNPVDGLIGHP